MTFKKNNKGNGYVIALDDKDSNKKHKEKIVLEAISKCLQEYPCKSINVVITDDMILVNTDKNNLNKEVKTTGKHHK